jgi:hypothetical protein
MTENENPQLTEEEKLVLLEQKFEKEREQYTGKIGLLMPMLRNMDTITEAQVYSLSYRQILVDLIYKYRAILTKHKNNDKNFKKLRIEFYKRNYDLRLDSKEMSEYIASDMAMRVRKYELIENQINFLVSSVDTLDKLGWAIRARIDIHNSNI